jgi:hypothetical protein
MRSLGPAPEAIVALLYAAVGAALLFADRRLFAAALAVLAAWRGGMATVLAEREGQPTWVRALSAVLNLCGEGALLVAGAAWASAHQDQPAPFAAGFLAFAGAILLSYARTRIRASAGLDLADGPWGIASREVRLLVLAAGIIVGQVYWALWIIAALGNGAVLGHLGRLRVVLRDG